MAMKARVRVYPAYLDGTQRGREMAASTLLRCSAQLAFGDGIEFAATERSDQDLEVASSRIRAAVEDLRILASK